MKIDKKKERKKEENYEKYRRKRKKKDISLNVYRKHKISGKSFWWHIVTDMKIGREKEGGEEKGY